ncbi:MAG: hypothetical protein KC635_13535 [Myxococcales bacterium]|nr:hypothetical protein [Myxococcales bacterium]MCB9731430.1 hypothetical protein [Deltaproteobacteria bacterium]
MNPPDATSLAPPRRRSRRLLASRGRAIAQLARHLRGTGRWWLLPMVGVLLVAALLVGIVAVVEVAAPFVYSLF